MVQGPLAAEPTWSCPAAFPALPILLQVWFPGQTLDQSPPSLPEWQFMQVPSCHICSPSWTPMLSWTYCSLAVSLPRV